MNAFYRRGVDFLPVVDSARAELCGILSRTQITALAVDQDRARREFTTIPDEYYVADLGEAVAFVSRQESVATISQDAKTETTHEPALVLALVSGYQKRRARKGASSTSGETAGSDHASDVKLWLSRLILSSIPFPLFVLDLNGNTLFYNGAFEARILSKPFINRSVPKAERLFLEMSRQMLADAAARGIAGTDLVGVIKQTGDITRMVNLQDGGKIVGYLFALESEDSAEHQIIEKIKTGAGLDSVLDRLEKNILVSILSEIRYNISHAADLMKTKRTTLQSRMKRLRIPLKTRPPQKTVKKATRTIRRNATTKRPKTKKSSRSK